MWGRRPPSGSLTRAQMRHAMSHTHLLAPFGRYHGIPVQGQPGDAAICIAPQQAGKTTRLAIGRVADAPGACLVTSTKADIVDATIYVRHNTAAPFIILREDPQAEPGWVEDLTKYTRGAAPETVASTEMSLNSAVPSLSRQQVLALVCPQPGQGFDVDAFVARGQDTIYCLSEGGADVSTPPAGDRIRRCDRVGCETPQPAPADRRLDPILTLVLDEAPNVAPLPDMQALLTDGGGRSARCRSARRCCSTAPPCGRRSRCRRGGNARTRPASLARSSRRAR